MAGVGSSIPEAASKKAEAATNLGNDAYQKISEAAGPTAEKLRAAAPDFTSNVLQGGQQAAAQIQQQQSGLGQQLSKLVQAGSQGLTQAVAKASQSLNQLRAQITAQLGQLQSSATARIQQAKAQQSAGIAQAGQQLQGSLNQTRAHALSSAEQSLSGLKQQIAGKPISKAQAPRIIAQVVPRVVAGLQSATAATQQSIAGGLAGLRQVGQSSAAQMKGIGAGAASGVRTAASTAGRAVNQAASQSTQQIGQIGKQTIAGGTQLLGQVKQAVTQAVTAAKGKFSQLLGQFTSGLAKTAADSVSKAKQPLGDLGGRISAAQAKIESKYQQEKAESQKEKSWLESAWDSITNFLSKAWDWIKENWKTILVVIAIIVVAVVIAIAAAALAPLLAGFLVTALGVSSLTATIIGGVIIGVGAGIVGRVANQVITNVATEKSPFDIEWGTVFDPKAMLVDAITGGVGAGVGQVLSGASLTTKVLANAGLAGGGGVLNNVVNRKPPFDDATGLLISMLSGAGGTLAGHALGPDASTTLKSVTASGVALTTGVVNNLAHGESALHDPGNLAGSTVTAMVSTAASERFGQSQEFQNKQAAEARQQKSEPTQTKAPAVPTESSVTPKVTETPPPVVHETSATPKVTETAPPVATESSVAPKVTETPPPVVHETSATPKVTEKAPPAQTETTQTATGQEVAAAKPPLSPEAQARYDAAYEFYLTTGMPAERIGGHLKGIDFNQPTEVHTIPKGTVVEQWQVPGATQGSYYGKPGTKPTHLGINSLGIDPVTGLPVPKTAKPYILTEDVKVLKSTADAIVDDWSVPTQPVTTEGGATQYYSPRGDKSKFQSHVTEAESANAPAVTTSTSETVKPASTGTKEAAVQTEPAKSVAPVHSEQSLETETVQSTTQTGATKTPPKTTTATELEIRQMEESSSKKLPTGMGSVDEHDQKAHADYKRIRANTEDVSQIAERTGISPDVLARIKEHLFVKEHQVATVEGQPSVTQRFAPDRGYAELWEGAQKGTLSAEQLAQFQTLITHENVELTLNQKGLELFEPHSLEADGSTGMRPFKARKAHDLAGIADHGFPERLVNKIPPEIKAQYLHDMVRATLEVHGTMSPEALATMPLEVQQEFQEQMKARK